MAVCRAWSMACTSGPKDPGSPDPETWVAARAGARADGPRADGQGGWAGGWAGSGGRQVPGQLYPV